MSDEMLNWANNEDEFVEYKVSSLLNTSASGLITFSEE